MPPDILQNHNIGRVTVAEALRTLGETQTPAYGSFSNTELISIKAIADGHGPRLKKMVPGGTRASENGPLSLT